MEHLEFDFGPWPAATCDGAGAAVLAGVVGSGNLEVMLESASLNGRMHVSVDTPIDGFGPTWRAVLSDFAERECFADVQVTINDAGATPAVVALRLAQAAGQWRQRR